MRSHRPLRAPALAADGRPTPTLTRLAPGTVVRSGAATATAGAGGRAAVPVAGGSTVTWWADRTTW